MATEIEAKFSVTSFAAVRKALRSENATFLGTCEEHDLFFDTPGRELYDARSALRLRRIKVLRGAPGGTRSGWLLTMKGPRKSDPRVKVRRETQTALVDGEAMREVLEALGLRVTATLTKRRASYRLGDCRVELDQPEGLGRFVEIEGPDRAHIEAVRRRLNLPDEPVTRSYLAMVTRDKGAD
jgi:adenylate cyclase class 2